MDDEQRAYYRRRADEAADRRLARMERKVDDLDSKVDILSARIALGAGGTATLVILANIIGPAIANKLFGH